MDCRVDGLFGNCECGRGGKPRIESKMRGRGNYGVNYR